MKLKLKLNGPFFTGILALFFSSSAFSATDTLSKVLATTPEGYWINAGKVVSTSSTMSSVAWDADSSSEKNGPSAKSIHGTQGPAAVFNCWNGGVLDTDEDRLLVWGGGHQAYYGNEIYAFNLKTLTWSRLTVPSSIAGWNQAASPAVLPDGNPGSGHSYNSLKYLPGKGLAIFGANGAADNAYGTANGFVIDLHAQSPDSIGKWTNSLAPCPAATHPISAVDPLNDHIFQTCQQAGGVQYYLTEYDPALNTWVRRSDSGPHKTYMTAAIDPVHRTFVAVGGGELTVFSLKTGQISLPASTGSRVVQNGPAPGFVWSESLRKFVGWYGGSTLYFLDPVSWEWTEHAATGGAIPTAANGNGTYGRFGYDPFHKAFFVVNRWNESVYIWKPDF